LAFLVSMERSSDDLAEHRSSRRRREGFTQGARFPR